MPEIPKVIGHRGAAERAPENTLASLQQAFAEGARMVEIDVRLSADGVPILLHDDTLDRTTSGRGPAVHWTAADLGRLDAGIWMAEAFRGEPVPTLSEVIRLCGDLGIGLNIEIKPNPGQDRETARRIAEVLEAEWPDTLAWPLISSFRVESLLEIRRCAPFLPRGVLFGPRPRDWFDIVEGVAATTVHLGARFETLETLQSMPPIDRPILLYTVNDAIEARHWLRSGVASIISDNPGPLLRALEEPSRFQQMAR